MKCLKNRKGMGLQGLLTVGILLVVITITLSIGADILGKIQGTQTANGYPANISTFGLQSVNTMGQYMPTISLVLAAAVIISILIGAFMVKSNQ